MDLLVRQVENIEPNANMPENYSFPDPIHGISIFTSEGKRLSLKRLFGFECGNGEGMQKKDEIQGLAVLQTNLKRWQGNDFELRDARIGKDEAGFLWEVGTSGLHWQSKWAQDNNLGIWSRRDRLFNASKETVVVTRCLARFTFSPGQYELYSQASSWSHESQGHWSHWTGGRLSLRSQAGRTNQGTSPYLFLRRNAGERGIAFHILPVGNWVIHVDQTYNPRSELEPFLILEMGLSDDLLSVELSTGSIFELPEILVQGIPSGRPEAGATAIQAYALQNPLSSLQSGSRPPDSLQKFPPQVIYNTWFDQFEFLDLERLRLQLAAAKRIGCEILTVDAGWYGAGQGLWQEQVGDWREKPDGAFYGRMAEFAGEVRAAGMDFGLWVEPERYHTQSPAFQDHSDWFLPARGGYWYPDLAKPDAYDFVLGGLLRLVETYGLAWIKIDFNLELGDALDELHGYYERWYALLDELRSRCPGTFIEGCASGGMRLELRSLIHFDGHFLSDSVNPVDVLRITQGMLLRLPVGRLTKWAVMRPFPGEMPRDGQALQQGPDVILATGSDGWASAQVTDLDFLCRAALPGIFGVSGDLQGLPETVHQRLSYHVDFYKRWREFLYNCVCEPLTPVGRIDDRSGWVAFHLRSPQDDSQSLLLVFRLEDGTAQRSFYLAGLSPNRHYRLTDEDIPGQSDSLSGKRLAEMGISVHLGAPNRAAVKVITAEPD